MESRVGGPRAREVALAGIGMLIVMLATLSLGRGWGMFMSPAWLDEYHSIFVAGRGTLGESMRALAQGADFNPPLLPALQRAVGALAGGLDLTGRDLLPLRILSFACVWGGLVAVYALLRRRFEVLVAFTGAFSLWTHPLFMQHSFEARFYGPWLLFAALFACALTAERERPWRDAAVATSAIALCLIHYFGVFTWGLAVGAYALHLRWHGGRWPWRLMAPAALGPLALAACLPLYLSQRSALSVATWIRPSTVTMVIVYILLVFWRLLALSGAIRAVAHLAPAPSDRRHSPARSDHGSIVLLSFGLLPVVLILFSLVIQPTLIDRYAMVGVLACAPIVAASTARLRPVWQPAVLALCIALGIQEVRHRAALSREGVLMTERIANAVMTNVGAGETIAVDERFILYPLANRVSPALAGAMVFPELADSMRVRARDYDLVERDAARVHARLYGVPTLSPVESLRQLDQLWLVTRADTTAFGDRWLGEHIATRVAPHLFRLQLPAAAQRRPAAPATP